MAGGFAVSARVAPPFFLFLCGFMFAALGLPAGPVLWVSVVFPPLVGFVLGFLFLNLGEVFKVGSPNPLTHVFGTLSLVDIQWPNSWVRAPPMSLCNP